MANLLGTNITGAATISDRIVIGGNFSNNAYNSVSSTRLHFGGGNSDALENYYIGTNLNDYGGNYTKLDLRWHTGIRMGAQPGYGGIRFYDTEDLGTVIFSVGTGDSNIRVTNTLYSAAYRGNANVAGTGEATYHPAGIYSTGTNWLYGTMYMNVNSINEAADIRLYNSSYSFRARYTAGSDIYHGSLNWYGLQLGNNGANYIVAGRTNTGGDLRFYVNNTSDFTTINGTLSAIMHSTGRTTFGGGTDYGYTLNVDGSFYATDWIRVGGTQGLYFESYGGGWRMTDSSYIRSYNGKALSMEGASVDYVGSIYMNGGVYVQTYNNRNLLIKSTGGADSGILGRGSSDQFAYQIYGDGGGSYGFLGYAWGDWDLRKVPDGALYMNDNNSYYLHTNSTSNFYALNIQGNAVVHSGNIGSQSVNYASSAGSAGLATYARRIDGPDRIGFNVGGDSSTFYPIAIYTGAGSTTQQYSEFIIERGGYEDPGYTGIGFSTFNARFTYKPSGWGYQATYFNLEQLSQTTTMLGDYVDQYQSSQAIIWLRGGTRYNIYSVYGSITLLFANESGTSYSMTYGTYDPITSARTKATTTKYYEGSVRHTGAIFSGDSIQAPIFYDSDNTGYYVNPANTSNVNRIDVLNTYVGNAIYFGGGNNYFNWDGARINSNVGIQSGSDMRAPIFYDSNDTGYYADFNSTGNTAIRVRGGMLMGPNPTWGAYLQVGGDGNNGGSYANVVTTNGNLHLDSANGYSTYINHYYGGKIYFGSGGAGGGIYYHSNFSTTGNLHIGGADADASYRLQVSGTGYATSDFRAPIFYDSNDTGYYLDPNSTSNLNTVYAGTLYGSDVYTTSGWFRNHTNTNGIYWSTTGWHLFPADSADFRFHSGNNSESAIRMETNGTIRGYVYANSSNEIGFLNEGRSWRLRVYSGGAVQSYGDFRAPIFYDSADTSYYLDPNSNSVLSTVQIGAGLTDNGTVRIYMPGGAWSVNNPSGTGGAIKISLPTGAFGVNTMMSMTVQVYEYSTGQSFTIRLGGYNYYNHDWYNVFAYMVNDSGKGGDVPVYFGNDGSRDVIWIGEPGWSWSYPNVFVTDFQAGHSQHSAWKTGWSVSFDTGSRTNVTQSRTAYRQIDKGNIATQAVSYADDAGFADNADTVDGYHMNQSLLTTSGPTFANVYNSGWFRNYGNQGLYNQDYGTHFYSNGGANWVITGSGGNVELQFRSNHQSTLRGWVYATTSNEIGFLSEDGNWVLRTWNRGVEAYGSMRAPIYYDSSNTNRYLDLNSTAADAMVISGGIHISRDNVTGNGIILADDGDIVDLNDGYCAMRFSYGIRIHSGNRAGGAVHTLHSDGNAYFSTSAQTPIFLVNNHSDNTKGYRIYNTSNSSVSAMFVNSSNQLVIAAGAVDQINLNKKVYVNGVALGVNVAPSATAGRIDASNDIVAYSSSDERLKQNITPIENALDKVKSLTGVEFDWKPEYKHAHGYEGHDTGIIAQQVQEVIPSAVRTNDTGFLAVRYEKLIGLLVEGMKEQQAQIEELKAKLDGLTK